MRHFNLLLAVASAAVVNSERCQNRPVPDLGPSGLQSRDLIHARQAPAPPPITLFVHIIAASTSPAEGHLEPAQVDRQVQIIKERFQPTGITFNHDPTKHRQWHVRPEWSGNLGMELLEKRDQMKQELRRGDYRTLNLYLRYGYILKDGLQGGEGNCENPWPATFEEPEAAKNLTLRVLQDGCVVSQNTLEGGSHPYANLGLTAVHEIGHWFGLFHTFEVSPVDFAGHQCLTANLNDFVDDTPRCMWDSSLDGKCPLGRKTCDKEPGVDPVQNYMHYSSDACYTHFTPGQIQRMYHAYETWRTNVTVVPRPL